MITLDLVQGSSEWFAAKAGVPSASNFDKIVTSKGEPSKQREKYMYQLAGERITGKPEETYQNAVMQRGIDMESEARNLLELLHDVKIEPVGLCFPDEKRMCAASPDGLIGDDGVVEIKCPIISTHVKYLLGGGLPIEYFEQTQGQLYVTGRKYCVFISYYPGLRPLIVRVERDYPFIATLDREVRTFAFGLDIVVGKIR